MYQNFIGIDISKNSFSVACHGQKEVSELANNMTGFKNFYKNNKNSLKKGLVVLETTGGYEMNLIRFLQKHQCSVHRANTSKVKYFIRSFGKLGKSDAIDALGLAHYGFDRNKTLDVFVENPGKKLLKLVQRRNDLKKMIVQEKNRLKAPDQGELKKSFETVIKALEKQMKKIEEQIDEISTADKSLNEKKAVLKTVDGIGDIIAIQLLALLPELGTINRKKIASLAGVAPHPNESGEKIGHRFTRGGRADIKPILFMAAMAASRSHSKLGAFYQKLIKAGKKKMVALTALMRKIVVIANARMNEFLTENPIATT